MLVAEACGGVGKRQPSAFALRVDFTIWPDDFRRSISDTHLVLGRRYLSRSPREVSALRQALLAHLERIV